MTDSKSLSSAMLAACNEARKYMGATSPNPPVGAAALDKAGNILAVAAHHRAGDDHAEAALLKLCREKNILSQIHTLCVTLEPCNHHGRTPPCSESIIAAGIKRVAIGTPDPNPNVQGGGAERLRQAGIEVIENIEAEACRRSMHAFLFHATTGKAFITVKRAFDTKGSMIPPKGKKTFTSQESLILAHRLRKKSDAIVTGSGTILIDNPSFTIRHVPDHPDKRRILAILDRRRRVPQSYLDAATERGFDCLIYDDLDTCITDLTKHGAQDVLVEAGPALSTAVLNSPHWTMGVDIHKSTEDQIDLKFNFNEALLPLNTADLELKSLLPL